MVGARTAHIVILCSSGQQNLLCMTGPNVVKCKPPFPLPFVMRSACTPEINCVGGNTEDRAATSRRAGQPDPHPIHMMFGLKPDQAHTASSQNQARMYEYQTFRMLHWETEHPGVWTKKHVEQLLSAFLKFCTWKWLGCPGNISLTCKPDQDLAQKFGLCMYPLCWSLIPPRYWPDQVFASLLETEQHEHNIPARRRPEARRQFRHPARSGVCTPCQSTKQFRRKNWKLAINCRRLVCPQAPRNNSEHHTLDQ